MNRETPTEGQRPVPESTPHHGAAFQPAEGCAPADETCLLPTEASALDAVSEPVVTGAALERPEPARDAEFTVPDPLISSTVSEAPEAPRPWEAEDRNVKVITKTCTFGNSTYTVALSNHNPENGAVIADVIKDCPVVAIEMVGSKDAEDRAQTQEFFTKLMSTKLDPAVAREVVSRENSSFERAKESYKSNGSVRAGLIDKAVYEGYARATAIDGEAGSWSAEVMNDDEVREALAVIESMAATEAPVEAKQFGVHLVVEGTIKNC